MVIFAIAQLSCYGEEAQFSFSESGSLSLSDRKQEAKLSLG